MNMHMANGEWDIGGGGSGVTLRELKNEKFLVLLLV